MSEWHSVEFKDYFAIGLRNGLTKPSRIRGSGSRMVNMKEIFGYDVITDKTPMELVPVTDNELENSSLEYDDLLFARQSLVESGAGKIAIFKGNLPTVFESHLIRCRIDKSRASPDFIYYLFKSPIGKGTVSTIVQQVAAAGIKSSDLQNLVFSFPPFPEQKAIASVLSSLDDKIDLLHRQNKTLEAMAETLFRQWFVEEVQDNWNEKELKDILEFVVDNRGKTAPTSETGIPLIATNCIKNNNIFPTYEKIRYISEETYSNWFRSHPEPGDLIFVNKGTPGCVNLAPNPVDFCIAQDMIALRVNKNHLSNYYLKTSA